MANVLPPSYQKKVWRLQRSRALIALSCLCFLLAFVGAVALVPSYLALEFAGPPTPLEVGGGEREPIDPSAIPRTQTLLAQLAPIVSATTSPTALFAAALNARPAGVIIEVISYNAAEKRVSLSGSAPREAINAYRSALTATGQYTAVSVPVGALVGTEGGRFSITLTLK